jgi:hypothetical protein
MPNHRHANDYCVKPRKKIYVMQLLNRTIVRILRLHSLLTERNLLLSGDVLF